MKKHPKGALLKLPFFTTDMKKKFFTNLWLTFHSWSPAKLSITLSVYKTISIAESDLFLQKMTKKSDLLAANHFFKVHLSLAI